MDKIKKWYRSIPIWLAFFLYALAGLGIAAFFANRVTGSTYYEMVKIRSKPMEYMEGDLKNAGAVVLQRASGYSSYNIDVEDTGGTDGGEDTGDVMTMDVMIVPSGTESGRYVEYNEFWDGEILDLNPQAKVAYRLQQTRVKLLPFFIYAVCLLAAALLFWFTKLRRPLRLLEAASERIAENELDFPLDYQGRDEMAKLCAAFERMRAALDGNNGRMLRMIDEQQKLNDAYTHDLRTPIAVLKGYTDLLEKYMPTGKMPEGEVLDTVRTMSAQVARLERFVSSMNTAQKLTDVEIRREAVPAEELAEGMRETARIMAEGRNTRVEVESSLGGAVLNIDPGAVTQVYENLLCNALRFAGSRITARLETRGDALALSVADDGPGFTEKELVTAARPYYSGKNGDPGTHFGLGLYICRTLCEKHGGSLTLANGDNGGGSVTAEFGMA